MKQLPIQHKYNEVPLRALWQIGINVKETKSLESQNKIKRFSQKKLKTIYLCVQL